MEFYLPSVSRRCPFPRNEHCALDMTVSSELTRLLLGQAPQCGRGKTGGGVRWESKLPHLPWPDPIQGCFLLQKIVYLFGRYSIGFLFFNSRNIFFFVLGFFFSISLVPCHKIVPVRTIFSLASLDGHLFKSNKSIVCSQCLLSKTERVPPQLN